MIFRSNWNVYGHGISEVNGEDHRLSFLSEYASPLSGSLADLSISKYNNQVKIKGITLSEKIIMAFMSNAVKVDKIGMS